MKKFEYEYKYVFLFSHEVAGDRVSVTAGTLSNGEFLRFKSSARTRRRLDALLRRWAAIGCYCYCYYYYYYY